MKNLKHKIWPAVRKVTATVSLSVGMLAIANVETIWQEYRRADHQERNRFLTQSEEKPKHRTVIAVSPEAKATYKPLQSELSQTFEEDELLDANPFAHLSTLDPLQKIMQKGVAHFKRETFRSPGYQEEGGYDMLSYDIEHTDGTKSGIVAYLEKNEGSETRSVFVVFMVADGANSNLSFFRSGQLIEQSQLSTAEVQTLVQQKLGQGIPFLSVSR